VVFGAGRRFLSRLDPNRGHAPGAGQAGGAASGRVVRAIGRLLRRIDRP